MNTRLFATQARRRVGRSSLAATASIGIALSLAACAGATTPEDELLGGNAEQSFDDWNYEYEKCMTDVGFDLSQGIPMTMSGDSAEPNSEFQSANEMCLEKVGNPPAVEGMLTDAEQEAMMLAFAQCMREAGYDYPDPKPIAESGGMTVQAFDIENTDPADVEKCDAEAGLLVESSANEGAVE